MRSLKSKVKLRVGIAALALSVVGVLVSALPAYAAAPTITSFNPSSGVPGTMVTITGTGFTSASGLTAKFNGSGGTTAATVNASSNTSMTAMVPCGAADGPIYVQNADGNATSGSNFDVTSGNPTVASFAPTFGNVGTVVTITGTEFCGVTAVKFNNTNATVFTVNNPGQITATVPTGATSGKISVSAGTATGTSATNFIVGPPVISSFSPTIAPVGSSVTISGSNFTGVTSVKFNGTSATFTVSSDTSISTTVPSGATTGPITVTNAVGTATGATFTVGEPTHNRSVTFKFEQNSRVSGHVNVSDNYSFCNSFVPVVIQRKSGGGWKWVDTTATGSNGDYKTYIPPGSGDYRAKVNKQTLQNGTQCLGDTSPVRHHNG